MTTIALASRSIHQRAASSVRTFRFPWKLMYVLGISTCIIMLVLYIYLVDQLTKGAYVINRYQQQISSLSEQNDSLENSFAESSFLGSVAAKAEDMHFEKTAEVTYVQLLDPSLADAMTR